MLIDTYFSLLIGILVEIIVAVGLIYFIHVTGHTPTDDKGVYSKKNAIILMALFSLAGLITSRFFTFSWDHARININDGVALLAGLFGGPISGIGAGIAIGLDRFALGGNGALPCALSPIVAGIIGGVVWHFSKKQFPKTAVAILSLVLVEIVHFMMLILLATEADDVFRNLGEISFVQLDFNLLAMIVFAVIYNYRIRSLPVEGKGAG